MSQIPESGSGGVGGAPDFEALFREHAARIYRVACRVTGSGSDAEDVLQTIFLRMLRREDADFELGPQAGSYLHRAAVNAALDLLRSRRRARAVSIDEEDGPSETLEAERTASPSTRVEGREIKDQVREALGRLNPRAAEVFSLRYFGGFGNTEIAEMLGTTRTAVGVTLHRSRERLKEELSVLVGA